MYYDKHASVLISLVDSCGEIKEHFAVTIEWEKYKKNGK